MGRLMRFRFNTHDETIDAFRVLKNDAEVRESCAQAQTKVGATSVGPRHRPAGGTSGARDYGICYPSDCRQPDLLPRNRGTWSL